MSQLLKNIILKLRILIVLVSCFSTLHAEYILYKITKNDYQDDMIEVPLLEEYVKAFKILVKYQFPMSLEFFHGTDEEDWTDEHYQLLKNEQKFLQKKLDELNFGIKIAFMPKTLHELFFVYFHFEDVAEFFEGSIKFDPNFDDKDIQTIFFKTYLPLMKKLNNTWIEKEFLNFSQKVNTSAQKIHYILNEKIIEYLVALHFDFVNQGEFKQIAKVLLHEIRLRGSSFIKKNEDKILIDTSDLVPHHFSENFENNLPEKLLLHCIELEAEAHKKNQWLLYRGSDSETNSLKGKVDEKDENSEVCPYSSSYGNSVFAGMLFDFSISVGATAYGYFLKRKFSKCLKIPISDYCKKGLSHNCIYVSPFGFAALFLMSEDFHCRTKVHVNSTGKVSGWVGGLYGNKYFITPLINQVTQNEFELYIQKYEAENTVIINKK